MADRFSLAPESVVAMPLSPPPTQPPANRPQRTPICEPLHAAFVVHYPQAVRCQYWRYLRRQRRAENRELAGRQLRNAASNAWRTARGVFRRAPKR
ncbi:hypothetical protein [Marinimicrobium agarilyticum]|uniref:hypothetical protein n=1 Tax=Marinimicrobium agarilyticum TaxID=306546 RepID=UPI0012F65CD0|nr:hypothetical protein [Marinimicrobium agarilyticum]